MKFLFPTTIAKLTSVNTVNYLHAHKQHLRVKKPGSMVTLWSWQKKYKWTLWSMQTICSYTVELGC